VAGEFRDIPLPEYVSERIDKQVAEHGTTSDGYLFQGRKYKLVVRRSYQEDFQRSAARAGLPPEFIPHSLRHLYAFTALAEGVPITEVSRWLGHNSIEVTHQIYGHLVPSSTLPRSRRVRVRSPARSTITAAANPAAPTGTFTRNTGRQDSPAMLRLISAPPMTWPAMRPPPITDPKMPRARLRSAPLKVTRMMARTWGYISAPPTPWTARAPIRRGAVGTTPHRAEAVVKIASPVRNSRLRPYIYIAQPPPGDQQDAVGQHIGGDHELDRAVAGVQIPADRRDGDVDDGHIDNGYERADQDHAEDQPPPGITRAVLFSSRGHFGG
jgi:Phage integrase family